MDFNTETLRFIKSVTKGGDTTRMKPTEIKGTQIETIRIN